MLCPKCKTEISDSFTFCPHCGKKQVKTAAPKPKKRGNGTGTVYKLSGHRRRPWVAAQGKIIIGYYAEKGDANSALEAIVLQGIPDGFHDTIAQVYERWKDAHFREIEVKAREGYEIAWRRLEPLHQKRIREIRTIDFQRIVDGAMTLTKNPKPLSKSGKEKIKLLCGHLCKQAMVEEIINRNYGEYIKIDKEIRKEKEIFTADEIEKLFADGSETAKIILTLIYSGLRINELLHMKCEAVDLNTRIMVGGEKTEAGKNRMIPISKKILPFIKEWYDIGNEYLVVNTSGNPINAANFRNREYYPLLDALQIGRKSPHCTRHTFASLMASAGVRPENLQKIIGHSKYSTTAEIYIHQDANQLLNEVDKI